MQKAAKEKSFILWIVASVALFCAPSFASSVRDLPAENRVEIFLLEGQNRVEQSPLESANRVENYDSRWEVALESPVAPNSGVLRSSSKLNSVERASPELLDAIRAKGRTIKIVQEGSEEARYLDFIGAEANVGGETMTHILLRTNPGKAAALEEFLHGTQHRLGIIKRLGVNGSETHVKDFMIRHRRLLGLGDEDVDILRQLMDAGL